jgi:hypothetical protein
VAAAQRQHRAAFESQNRAREAAVALGETYSVAWLSRQVHTMTYDQLRDALTGRVRMTLLTFFDLSQTVSDVESRVEAMKSQKPPGESVTRIAPNRSDTMVTELTSSSGGRCEPGGTAGT